MFKKSLIAMTIAGASLTATAGVLTFDVNETAAQKVTADAIAPAFNGCAAIATTYSATVDLDGNTANNAGVNDTITVTDSGIVSVRDNTTNTLTYTGADACTLVLQKDVLVAASASTYSAEGAVENGVTVTATLIAGVGGVTAEDTIIITVDGGVVDEDASAGATLTSTRDVGVNPADKESTFTLLGVVGNQILFTVDTGQQVAREIFNLAGLVVTANDGATAVSLSAATQNTANVQYDTSPKTELVVLETQYTSTIDTKFDGVIDVGTARLTISDEGTADAFGAGEVLNQDTLEFSTVENTANGNLDPDSVVLTINGDFSWMAQLDVSDDGEDITSAELATGLVFTSATNDAVGEVELNDAMNKLTITVDTTDGDIDASHTVALKVPGVTGTTSLNEQTFTGSISAFDDTAEVVLAPAMTGLGEWQLNGSVVEVPYMPFGPNTQPILRHTNTGVQTGDISARYMLEGVDTTWQSVGVVVEDAAPGLVNLLGPVMDAVVAATGTTSGKVALEITTNVPGADVTVFAAAKVSTSDQDRLTIGAFSN